MRAKRELKIRSKTLKQDSKTTIQSPQIKLNSRNRTKYQLNALKSTKKFVQLKKITKTHIQLYLSFSYLLKLKRTKLKKGEKKI